MADEGTDAPRRVSVGAPATAGAAKRPDLRVRSVAAPPAVRANAHYTGGPAVSGAATAHPGGVISGATGDGIDLAAPAGADVDRMRVASPVGFTSCTLPAGPVFP